MATTVNTNTTTTDTNTKACPEHPHLNNKESLSSTSISTGNGNTGESPQLIESVQGKLGPFWPNNPDAWFKIAEVQFSIFSIKADKTKLGMTLTALTHFPEILGKVVDVIERLPENDRYEYLKAALINRLSSSKQQRLEELLEKEDLGDKRPSEVLRHMRSLATGDLLVNEDIIRSLWLRRLPQSVKIPLVAIGDKRVDELADVADKIYEVYKAPSATVYSASYHQPNLQQQSHQHLNTPSTSLESRIARIESMLENLNPYNAGRGRSRQRSNNRYDNRNFSWRRNRSRSSSNKNSRGNGFCYFHQKFGASARNCRPPCSFSKQQVSTDQTPN